MPDAASPAAPSASPLHEPWLAHALRIQAIAAIGLQYSTNGFDVERYTELAEISTRMLAGLAGTAPQAVADFYAGRTDYPTPKVDVRGVIVREGRILLVREKVDGCWTPPGGWCDIGLSPREVVVKEVREEAGLEVRPTRLLAVLDKLKHGHPPAAIHAYKIFIACEVLSGEPTPGTETLGVDYFDPAALPPLSLERITAPQIQRMLALLADPHAPALVD